MTSLRKRSLALLAGVSLLTCGLAVQAHAETPAPTVDDARAFLERAETALLAEYEYNARVSWAYQTNITFDTRWLNAKADAALTKLRVDLANEAKSFAGLDLPEDMARRMHRLKQGITVPAPSAAGAADELAGLTTRLSSTYSTGTIAVDGKTVPQNETELLMRTERDPKRLEEVWTKWRTVSKAMKDDYTRMVEIANEGARELGFDDLGAMWRSGYDMTPEEFEAEMDRLWLQVKPLYDELHCHMRSALNDQYGDGIVPLDQPIRADLLGNMWAQNWTAREDLVLPESSDPGINVDEILVENGMTPLKMVETGEAFFSSLGFDPLPETFWDRSQITKPRDREVVCHASAWDLDNEDDIRIKMCTEVNGVDFQTVHHELGHNYYQRAYKDLSIIFRTGAHDGFHEAIGDMIGLSITPEYLQQLGLVDTVPDASGDLGLLMQQGLAKVAFLPFGLLMDKWRWQVFSGELTPDTYNEGWWRLREEYQGVRAPNDRPADAFDPGAKYHIPNNTPYARYFLAHILQFQFYKSACDQIGWEGPLHRCSLYGADDMGARFNAMLELGASKPWRDALEAFTGTREMDGSAMIAYFAPLMDYLKDQNEGRQCGWTPSE